ncbi:type I glyceraldehyde-3-phosphate dehydrogenase [Candidatus Kaiserbacteria bacterium RIFCSPHIGHO2_02_FULL_54_11b]|uniref:Type I glyceraldehyde-3-phosphate dehydrogenase n=2 Tax=Candidatus Kaiseribacteriota TaxID=1752734 RepID=A0A1F6CPY7_9BACT|nr:MAG: type I glyceraldehyde-3-phosphate dehydrogenase [Candidatus Kaiserbacteria bacterium RIFCSPHIGHO2_01_FULL_54_36b]OGG64247.1 MAG: type I glyceraldehyde-3-phosphate dehydrogenase [Candidatus Kaiserbacteria bacterium RIFCSPHIGHO2_02_FULL_54_11b]
MTRIAINGFGRIGRGFFRAAHARSELEVVAINDLAPAENLAYLLKYDTVYGRFDAKVAVENGHLVVDGKTVTLTVEKEPAKIPWGAMQVDIVIESTGLFTESEKAKTHIDAGAKHVVITAPAKGEGVETILIGANEEKFASCGPITSNASCTTNAASPLVGILDEAIGIERAILNTTHAYTASQSLVDGGKAKDMREQRAAAQNMVPTSTGAAKATALAYPQLKGKFDGISVRVPVPSGSLVDITFVAKRPTSAEEVNAALKAAAASDRWKKVFAVTDEPLVSSDILGLPFGAIADLGMTRVVDGTLVKVLAWYDNEMGYTHTLIEHVLEIGKRLR